MKLYASPTSPYARKVQMCLIEKDIMDQVDIVTISPLQEGSETIIPGPLARVPVLELDDGTAVYDSPVICEVVDTMSPKPALIPTNMAARQQAMIHHALADGMTDSAFLSVMEGRRPDAETSAYWMDRWQKSIDRALSAMNEIAPDFNNDVDIAQIAFAAALGYLDFRLSTLDWRTKAPALAIWFKTMEARPSYIETEPKA